MGLFRDLAHRVRYALWDHDHSGGSSGSIAHASTTGRTANDHHTQAHDVAGADHTSTLTPGRMVRAKAATGTLEDATNTDAAVAAAVAASHTRQHSITSTSDHTSTATPGRVLKADANGLPVDATNTDAAVAAAVAASHAESHALSSHSDTTIAGLANNNVLQYNDPSSKWVNRTLAAAGIASTGHHATHEPTGSDAMAVDAAAGTGSLRALGTGALNAAAGNHTHIRFVPRIPDPSTFDWIETGSGTILITDGLVHDLDCSAIVPAGAVAILMMVIVLDNLTGSTIALRRKGNMYWYAQGGVSTQVANISIRNNFVVPCDVNRFVEYITTNTSYSNISLGILGWFL